MKIKTLFGIRSLLCLAGLCASEVTAQTFNYAEALQKSMFFYECQRSGPLPADNRVTWRGPSALNDGSDVGRNLTGGWYDAGDHVKFGFPMAYSVTTLAWGGIDFKQGYVNSGQLTYLKKNLRFVTDYLLKCHTAPNELYGQVGGGNLDHAWWGSAEVMTMARPAYKIDATRPGSDLAAETAAALAAVSILLAEDDPAYSQTLRTHAIQLYNFADTNRGKYSDAITDVVSFYNSWSGYNDELVWGAIWLYRATGDAAYLAKAESYYANLSNENGQTVKSYRWTLGWDDKSYGCYALLAKLTGKAQYKTDIERNLDYWTDGVNGQRVTYTPGGLAWLDVWGSLRYAANASFLALYYQDIATSAAKGSKYYNFAVNQIRYMLGANPGNRSLVCGFGNNPSRNPHHRTAHGAWANNLQSSPTESRHILYGALVGGPGNNDVYTDDRGDFQRNEVATDYNALFSGALAKLVTDFGGTPLANFPVAETPVDEFIVESRQNSAGANFFETVVWVNNHSAWPARVPAEFKFRIFINISEGVAAGYTASSYTVATNNGNIATVTPLQSWNSSQNIYYTEVQFKPGVLISPAGQGESVKEAQVRISLPSNAPAGAWDRTNDHSLNGIDSTRRTTTTIPLYADGTLVAGTTPGGGVNVPATGVSVSPTSASVAVGATTALTFTVSPANASNKSVTWSSSSTTVATVNASGVVTGVAAGSATVTVRTVDGGFTATSAITVTAAANTLTVAPTSLSVASAASSNPITVTSNVSWAVTDNSSWISMTPASGSGNSSFTIAVAANTGAARSGTVTVTGGGLTRTIAVNQAAVGNALNVSPASLSLVAAAGNGVISITANVAWTASDDQAWLSVSPASGTNNGSVTVSATANTGAARSGNVAITGGGITRNVAVSQAAGGATTPCANPTTVAMPLTKEGVGEFCTFISGNIAYVNSWNMRIVEINGVNYLNRWSNALPAKINGGYYIRTAGDFPWSHFEARN